MVIYLSWRCIFVHKTRFRGSTKPFKLFSIWYVNQCRVWPHLTQISEFRRPGILSTNLLMVLVSHSFVRSWAYSYRVWGILSLLSMALPNASHTCSDGFISGEQVDLLHPLHIKEFSSSICLCGQVLSCSWKMLLKTFLACGSQWFLKMSQNTTAVTCPYGITDGVVPS